MAHRNRWFTVFKNGWILHGYVSHNQRVGHGWLFIHLTRTEPKNLRRDEGEDHVDGVAEEPQWFDGQNVGVPVFFFFPGFFGRMVVVPLNKVMAKMLLSPHLFVVYGCYSCIMLYHDWLEVWNINFISPSIGNVIIPTDGSYFSEGLFYHQPDDVSISRYV